MELKESLVLLRIIGGSFGLLLMLWMFWRYRRHAVRRNEFLITSLFGLSVLIISITPDALNTLTDMLSMRDKQFGRLITILIFSNMLIWILIFGQRNKDAQMAIQFDLLVRQIAKKNFDEKDAKRAIKEITVIIPVLNESENLKQLLPRIPNRVLEHACSALIIDDGSSDNTTQIVSENGFPVVSNPINRGGGAALRLGYDIAVEGGAKIIVTMDGDGQHLPEEIEKLVNPILKDEYDFVIGSRVLGKREKDSIIRWFGIHVFNFLINLLAGTRISDCSNGFRAFRVESLTKVMLFQNQFHTAELIIDAARKGVRIGEAPVTILRRYSGQSKKGTNLVYGFNFSKTIFKTWLRK